MTSISLRSRSRFENRTSSCNVGGQKKELKGKVFQSPDTRVFNFQHDLGDIQIHKVQLKNAMEH